MNETELVEVAERLESSMNNLAAEVAAQGTYGRHNRAFIWVLIASVLLNFVVGGIAISASREAKEATSQAAENTRIARISCESGNESRRLGKQLWTYVLDLSEHNPNLTAYQKKQIAMFRGYIETVYAPRDCDNLPTIPSGTVTPTR